MYLPFVHDQDVLQGFPRTRGDVPQRGSRGSSRAGLPPHTRGCTPARSRRRVPAVASPAHAGMYLSLRSDHHARAGFPRTRGDVPDFVIDFGEAGRLPPHTRGCTADTAFRQRNKTASPAHAGMYRSPALGEHEPGGFPRTRGDVPRVPVRTGRLRELPPHTRGCTLTATRPALPAAASPAHAGMYPSPACRSRSS